MSELNGKHAPTIEIENVGPIVGGFSIDLSPGPGLYILRGGMGCGKSHTLECIDLIAGHKVDISLRDGALGGKVAGFGSSFPVTRARIGKRKGEFEGISLDAEKFTLEDITDPPVKDPIKADAHRIKAIASMTRSKSEPAEYHRLAGGAEEFAALTKSVDLNTDDPVLLASRIKGAFDAAAKSAESLAEYAAGQAKAYEASTTGINLDAPSDAATLAEAVDAAVADRSRLATLEKEVERAVKLRLDAKSKLDKTRTSYEGPTVARAEAMQKQADAEVTTCVGKVAELRAALQQAEVDRDKAQARLASANAAVLSARQHAELTAQLEELIERDTATLPSEDEIEASDKALAAARAAQELGVRVRDAKKKLIDAQNKSEESEWQKARAETLRNAAKQTFNILMKSVKLDSVRVQTINDVPRLVYEHPVRGETLFSDLSDGERVCATIDLLLPTIDTSERPGLIAIPQRLFQDLAPSYRDQINEYAREHGIFCFGALVDDGALRVEAMSGDYVANGIRELVA